MVSNSSSSFLAASMLSWNYLMFTEKHNKWSTLKAKGCQHKKCSRALGPWCLTVAELLKQEQTGNCPWSLLLLTVLCQFMGIALARQGSSMQCLIPREGDYFGDPPRERTWLRHSEALQGRERTTRAGALRIIMVCGRSGKQTAVGFVTSQPTFKSENVFCGNIFHHLVNLLSWASSAACWLCVCKVENIRELHYQPG